MNPRLDALIQAIKDEKQPERHNIAQYRMLLATALGSRFPPNCDPVWVVTISPPSSGKSEANRLLEHWEHTVWQDGMTDKSLVSGYIPDADRAKGKKTSEESSLLPKLHGKVMVVDEFSTIASMDRRACLNLTAQLRAAYRGSFSKAFGTGQQTFLGRFHIVMAGTDQTDAFMQNVQDLGHRFLAYRMHLEGGPKARFTRTYKRALTRATKHQWRSDLKNMTHEVLNDAVASLPPIEQEELYTVVPHPSGPIGNRLCLLAELISRARSLPPFKLYGLENAGQPTSVEEPSRVQEQLWTLGNCHRMLGKRDSWNAEDISLCSRLAWDSIHPKAARILACLWKFGEMTLDQLSQKLLWRCTVGGRVILSQYIYSQMVEQYGGKYRLTDTTRDMISTAWPDEERWWWPRISFNDLKGGL